jgi:hypothetical protein
VMRAIVPRADDNPVQVTVPLAAEETWAAVAPERGQATLVRIAAAEVAVTESVIVASLAAAADRERSAAAEVAPAAAARGPAVPAVPQA